MEGGVGCCGGKVGGEEGEGFGGGKVSGGMVAVGWVGCAHGGWGVIDDGLRRGMLRVLGYGVAENESGLGVRNFDIYS